MATPPPRLHLVHFSVDAADEDRDDDDDERTTERKGQCALLWCDEATARDPPSGCVPVDPVAGLASLGPGYRGVRGAEAVAALVGACASAAHVVPDATQRSKPDEELRITPNPSSEPLAVSPSAMALCVRVAAALGDDDGWRPTRVCELGSGTGAAGLLVARMLTSTRGARELGARPLVLLTDRDTAALEVIASNVRLNARGWARCVPQRLQWDRRDERSRATRRAAEDDRIPLHDQTHSKHSDALGGSSSGVPPPAPFDLVLASDVLRGSRRDDVRHLLDTATELLSGARRGARLVLSHPVSDESASFAASPSSARVTKTELTHLDFVDDDDDFVDGEYGDVGADEGHDDALDAFVAAARARGFAVREWFPETETESQKPKPKPFLAKNQKPKRVRTFDVYLPGACPGAHLAGYVDVAARRAVDMRREEDRELRALMRERYARGWTPPPSPPVPTMEPPARSSSSIGAEAAALGRDGDGDGGKMSAGSKQSSSPGKRKTGGFCVVS